MFSQRTRGGTRQARSHRGQDLEVELAVFLEETQEPHKRTISYNLPVYNALVLSKMKFPKHLM